MDIRIVKAIADETRMRIVELLLRHNHCVRALARKLGITEASVSQHLKLLREAGLLLGEKRGYFVHYDVKRDILRELARDIEALAEIERAICLPEQGGCQGEEAARCYNLKEASCPDIVREFCHGHDAHGPEDGSRCGCCHCAQEGEPHEERSSV